MLRNSIAKKAVVAVTGLLLFVFVIFHMLGNLQVFLGRESLNRYAEFLHSIPELLWLARIVLLAAVVLHIVYTIKLWKENRASRPQRYVMERTVRATRASRTMVLSGLLVLSFIIYHLLHFTVQVTDPRFPTYYEDAQGRPVTLSVAEAPSRPITKVGYKLQEVEPGEDVAGIPAASRAERPEESDVEAELAAAAEDPSASEIEREYRRDVYRMVVVGFRDPLVSLSYIVAMVLLGLHLSHGASAMFQTLGLTSPKYRPAMFLFGPVMATVIVIGNIAMPIAILLDHWTNLGVFDV